MDFNNYFQHQNPPKSYLVESILITVFCCMPFGIIAIVNASNVESRFKNGDYEGAAQSSKDAKKWVTIGFWSGLAFLILYGGLNVLSVLSDFN